jgi:hypothetical protein
MALVEGREENPVMLHVLPISIVGLLSLLVLCIIAFLPPIVGAGHDTTKPYVLVRILFCFNLLLLKLIGLLSLLLCLALFRISMAHF